MNDAGSLERVLLPLDLSGHYPGVEPALARIQPAEPVTLLHAIEPIRGIPETECRDFYRLLEDRCVETLGAFAEQLHEAGWPSKVVIEKGRRGPTIVRYAAEHEISLIVLASHPASPSSERGGVGSTSHQVALMAPCSVLLLRGDAQRR